MTCDKTTKCAEPCGLCPEQWPVPAGNECGEPNLMQLIGEYFDLGVAEGRESRDHDTKDGAAQRKLSEIRAALANQSPAVPAQSAGVPAVQSPAEAHGTAPHNLIALPPLPVGDRERVYAGHGNENVVETFSATHMREYARRAVLEAEDAWQSRANVQPKGTQEPYGFESGLVQLLNEARCLSKETVGNRELAGRVMKYIRMHWNADDQAPAPSQPQGTAEEWLRSRYGAYRGHFAWRELEDAFNAGATTQAPAPGDEGQQDWDGFGAGYKAGSEAAQQAVWEAINKTQARYLGVIQTAVNLLAAVDDRHASAEQPLKYMIPYGAVNALRAALEAQPEAQAPAVGGGHVQVSPEHEAAFDAALGLVLLPPIRVDRATHAALMESAKSTGKIIQAVVRDRLAPYAMPAPAKDGWRPIETAPKDGSMFLCWVRAVRYGETDEGQQYQQDASQVDFCWWRDGVDGNGYFDPACGKIGDGQDVTHWMPLPTAPGFDVPVQSKEQP